MVVILSQITRELFLEGQKMFLEKIKSLKEIFLEIKNAGGVCYLVGGSVRDFVLGCELKDLDIEVHKISLETLQKCLTVLKLLIMLHLM